jgi:hypothetical protein
VEGSNDTKEDGAPVEVSKSVVKAVGDAVGSTEGGGVAGIGGTGIRVVITGDLVGDGAVLPAKGIWVPFAFLEVGIFVTFENGVGAFVSLSLLGRSF